MSAHVSEKSLVGALICRGIAIGRPFFFQNVEDTIPEFSIADGDIEKEVLRFQNALNKAYEDTKSLQKKLLDEGILDGAAILEAHLQIMQDPIITITVEQQIRETNKNAEFVFQQLMLEYQTKFKSIADPFFRERFKDIQDICRRIIGYLRASIRMGMSDLPPNSIIFAEDLSAFDTAEVNSACVAGFVTRAGGPTSHAAIVARAKGIPYVSNIMLDHAIPSEDSLVIVDGRTGKIIVNPSVETVSKYTGLRDELQKHLHNVKGLGNLPAETYDGYPIVLSANVEALSELDILHQFGGHGVGLLRTESAFLTGDAIPSEEEQFALYRSFVEKMNGLPIVIRVFDWGGDKYLHNQRPQREVNPFLGCRAIRLLLREKAIFKAQLRAILRASVFGKVSILFPLISSLFELREAKALIQEAKDELVC
jgi:phosphotransferase system enzyme I (PtsI)